MDVIAHALPQFCTSVHAAINTPPRRSQRVLHGPPSSYAEVEPSSPSVSCLNVSASSEASPSVSASLESPSGYDSDAAPPLMQHDLGEPSDGFLYPVQLDFWLQELRLVDAEEWFDEQGERVDSFE